MHRFGRRRVVARVGAGRRRAGRRKQPAAAPKVASQPQTLEHQRRRQLRRRVGAAVVLVGAPREGHRGDREARDRGENEHPVQILTALHA